MLSQVVELIESKRRFAITSHIRPDGDSLGSSLGLYWLLRALDKEVEVIMRDPVPHAYRSFPARSCVRVTPARRPSLRRGLRHRVLRHHAPRPDRPRKPVRRQHRPPLDDRALRRHQLDRLDGLGRRRDDLQPLQGARRPRHARDRRVRLHGAHHRHRQLSLLEHLGAHLQGRVRACARGRQAGQGLAGRVRQLPLEQDRAAERGARRPSRATSRGAWRGSCRRWRCRSAPRPRTRTATASSTTR